MSLLNKHYNSSLARRLNAQSIRKYYCNNIIAGRLRQNCSRMFSSCNNNDDNVVSQVKNWVSKWVVGFGLCPWAAAVLTKDLISYIVVDEDARTLTSRYRVKKTIICEARNLINNRNGKETSLIIIPKLIKFNKFIKFSSYIETELEEAGLDSDIQIATFHPDYQFADTSKSDVTNYTNRSPYPILHLLKVCFILCCYRWY